MPRVMNKIRLFHIITSATFWFVIAEIASAADSDTTPQPLLHLERVVILAIVFLMFLLFWILFRRWQKVEKSSYFRLLFQDTIKANEISRLRAPIDAEWERGTYLNEIFRGETKRAEQWIKDHPRPEPGDDLSKLAKEMHREYELIYIQRFMEIPEIGMLSGGRNMLSGSGDGFNNMGDPWGNPSPGKVKEREDEYLQQYRIFQKKANDWIKQAQVWARQRYEEDLEKAKEQAAAQAERAMGGADFSAIRGRGPEFVNQLLTLSLIYVFFLFFAYLTWRAHAETQEASLYSKPEVSVIQQISKQMDSLTLAVRNLKPATLPIDSPDHRNRADKVGAGQITEQMTGKVTIDVPIWVKNTLIVIFFGSVILLIFGFGLVIKNRNFKNIGTPSIVISILSGLLSGSSFLAIKDNKIELDTLFTCKECGVDVSLGAPAKTIQLFGESPSFDIGTAEIDQKTVCIDTQKNIKKEWDDWLAELSKAWKERSDLSNTLLIVGSSDRQPLRGALAQQFGSNEGLARARAETVKKKLIEEINGNKENKGNVLDGRNIIILTAGPEKTPAVTSYVKQGEQSCNDLAGDRKVRLWINAATSGNSPRK